MEILVEFFYTASITIEEANVQTLLPAACLLQLQEIQDACCDFLKKQLDPSNCLGIRAFADTHACRNLLKLADKFTQQYFKDVSFICIFSHATNISELQISNVICMICRVKIRRYIQE